MPSWKVGPGSRGASGRGSMPRALAWRSRPTFPSRLTTRARGRRAKSPTEWIPQRSSVAATSASGVRRASGSGARNTASPSGGTTVGDSGRPAATRAASLLPATPTRAGSPRRSAAAASVRPRSASSRKCRSSPARSRKATPSPASSTRGETLSAASSSASWAARSHSASRARATSLGQIARACASVMPGWMPAARAGRLAATRWAALPLPSQTASASRARSGSLLRRAARGKRGTAAQARRKDGMAEPGRLSRRRRPRAERSPARPGVAVPRWSAPARGKRACPPPPEHRAPAPRTARRPGRGASPTRAGRRGR